MNYLPYSPFKQILDDLNAPHLTGHILTAGAEMHLLLFYHGLDQEEAIARSIWPMEELIINNVKKYHTAVRDLSNVYFEIMGDYYSRYEHTFYVLAEIYNQRTIIVEGLSITSIIYENSKM